MSDDIGGTPKAIAQAYDGDRNKISVYNGPDLTVPARGIVPYDPQPDQVSLTSLAHAMGFTARFAGHTRYFYSVAQHSLYVAAHLPPNLRLRGLLHDASEAYLTDIPSPYKMQIPGYRATEARVTHAIGLHFGIEDLERTVPEVKAMDRRALGHEANSFMPTDGDWYGAYYREAIAETKHLPHITTFRREWWMTESDAIAASMKEAAGAIADFEAAVTMELAMHQHDTATVARLHNKVSLIYTAYTYND